MKKRTRAKGYTLVELLVAILVGLIVLAAVTSAFISLLVANKDYLKSVRLNQELRSTISLITKDARRAGFNRNAATQPSNNPYTQPGSTLIFVPAAPNNTSVSFAYDATAAQTAVEVFGYRWNSAQGTIEVCTKTVSHCTAADAWQRLTDRALVEINAASFTLNQVAVSGGTLRSLTVDITGRLVADNNFTRRMTETIVLRN